MHPPLWVRWTLTLIAFGALALAALGAIRGSGGEPGAAQRAADAEADRLARIVMAEDQAPHTVLLRGGHAFQATLEREIVADMRRRIRLRELRGPLQGARCRSVAGSASALRAYRCSVDAADVRYPFVGVIDVRRRRITWCKRDPAATPAFDVPISPRCRA